MKPNLIDTWGIEANADDTNDYTTATPEPEPHRVCFLQDEEPFRILPATPAEWLCAFATVFLLWSLYCAVVVVQP